MATTAVLIPFRSMSLGERIRASRKRAGLTQVALSKALGISPQAVNNWERDRDAPSRENLIKLADAVRCDLSQILQPPILHEQGTNDTLNPVQVGVIRGRKVPFVAREHILHGDKLSVAQSIVYTSFDCGPRAFAIEVWDGRCEPAYPVGTRIIFDPDQGYEPGSFVLAASNGDVTCGVLRIEAAPGGSVTIVQPLNANWPAMRSDTHQTLKIVGVKTEAHTRG